MTTIQEMIKGPGGLEAIGQRIKEFQQTMDFFNSQEEALVAEHSHKWVAV